MIGGILTVIHVVVCFILILVILLQAGRGQGLSGPSFGGGNVQSLLGTRAADVLTKATTVAAIAFLVTSLGLDYLETVKSRSLLDGRRAEAPIDVEAVKKALSEAGINADELVEKASETAESSAVEAETLGASAEDAAALPAETRP